jgi:hypothetical protein
MALNPKATKSATVLFESARAGKATAASFEFLATLSVRDYDAGYPPNRYFGQTCVSRAENASFKLWLDANGRWKVDGALTLPRLGCKDHPAAGVSSIPLATLSGHGPRLALLRPLQARQRRSDKWQWASTSAGLGVRRG